MTVRRLAAIVVIFLGTALAWAVLGSSLVARAGQLDSRLDVEVMQLWGAPQRQVAPNAWFLRSVVEREVIETKDPAGRPVRSEVTKSVNHTIPIALESTRVNADLGLEHRRKGLLWYSAYTVAFKGTYVFRNPEAAPVDVHFRFPFPADDALFDDFVFAVDGRPLALNADVSKDVVATATVAGAAPVTLTVEYTSRGLETWRYAFVNEGTAQARDVRVTVVTNFHDVDYPAGTVSPSEQVDSGDGRRLTWAFDNLISGQAIGVQLPQKLNPGPFAARVTFFAPVSLLFFFAVVTIVGATYGPSLHPMHYWFLAAAFFAFHLLLAYLVDHISVHVAFAVSALVSLALVVSYLRLVTGMRHALTVAGTAQALFLVLFSYAFFFEGFTGLAITIGAILTLFTLMQMTAHVRWEEVFNREAHHAAR